MLFFPIEKPDDEAQQVVARCDFWYQATISRQTKPRDDKIQFLLSIPMQKDPDEPYGTRLVQFKHYLYLFLLNVYLSRG